MMIDIIIDVYQRLQTQAPLVHYVSNMVTAQFVADALLAIGAIPVMALAPEDTAVLQADAVVINLGTLTAERQTQIRQLVHQLALHKQAWVLDPVGIGSFPGRFEYALELYRSYPAVIIRGNSGEIAALNGQITLMRGVDALNKAMDSRVAAEVARCFNTTIACTGAIDMLSNGQQSYQVANGHALLTRISGAGCVASGLIAAALAVESHPLIASLAGLTWLGVAAEIAAERCYGTGSFRVALLDALAQLNPKQLMNRAQIR